MKKKNKFLAVLFALVTLISMTGFTANAATKATAITFSKTFDANLKVGYALTRTAVTTPEGLAVTYTSSDISVATVNENGQIVGKKPGKAVITASTGGLQASYNVVVVAADDAAAKAKEVFAGITVTVNDTTAPATYSGSMDYPITTYYFFSADNKKLGGISGKAYWAIVDKYKVQKVKNGEWEAPNADGDWSKWFADMFNAYRGLGVNSREKSQADQLEEFRYEVIRLTNLEREKAGLPALEIDQDAMAYAQIRAQEISANFSHTRPNGAEKELFNGNRPIENIAGAETPERVIEVWMNSPGHRGGILDKNAYAIGVGCYKAQNGNIYWSQEFVW